MQVYRELRTLTARPSPEEERRVPHALYGFVPAREAYSVGRYVADAARAIARARAERRIPIVVGGTGLYFKALLEGLSPIPAVPETIRAHWRAEARRLGSTALHRVLAERDPQTAARLRPTDPQRIVRALEVFEATGRPLADWQRVPGEPLLGSETAIRMVVSPERTELYRRCETRFEGMLEQGALDEVAALRALALDPKLPAMNALGVPPLLAYLAGEVTLEAAVTQANADTRRYAKRQLTWLRRNMIAWKWLDAQETERCRRGEFALI
jgi:tRNA dimethylallyltransferase